MKAITSFTYLAAVASPALALVQLPVFKREVPIEQLNRRATIQANLVNNVTALTYQAAITVGTPPQSFIVQVDTGSSDVWIVDKSADQCNSAALQAKYGPCFGGLFDSSASNTFNDSYPGLFKISYVDGSGSSGDLFKDTFGISGVTVKNQVMGLAFKTTIGYGLMGIGYDNHEAIVNSGYQPYPSVIDMMYSQSLINTKAYSLYLNDLTASSGSIIFGGADTQKFIGTLKTVPLIAGTDGVIREFLVDVTSISFTANGGSLTQITASTYSQPYLLDSGTAYTLLPANLVSALVTVFGASSSASYGGRYHTIACSAKSSFNKAYLSFTFGGASGPTINVPMDEWILPQRGSTTDCFIAMDIASSSSTFILGDTFLRSAYVVYDLTNNVVALAQTNFESTSSSLVEFAADSTIPSLTGQASGTTLEPHSAAGRPELNLAALGVAALTSALVCVGGGWFLF